jgi:hypothetical protein
MSPSITCTFVSVCNAHALLVYMGYSGAWAVDYTPIFSWSFLDHIGGGFFSAYISSRLSRWILELRLLNI